jgi:hypothetical protein
MVAIKHQAGASLLLWMFLIGAAGLAAVVGMRLAPIYIESYMVDGILEEVALESRNKKRNKHQVWSSMSKRFTINNINKIKKEHFSYKHEKGKLILSLKYEVRTKLVGNLDGIASFEKVQTTDSHE